MHNTPPLSHFSRPHRAAGFGLVEIMVALVIGMLAVIIILQVFSQSEERKRISTSGGDAQTNGTLAFYQVQNDIAQAGFGISSTQLLNCPLIWKLQSGGNIATPVTIAPVTINPSTDIIPAGDDNTDTVLVMYGSANSQPQGNNINGGTQQLSISQPQAFSVDDLVIVAPDSCSGTLSIDRVTGIDASSVTLQTGSTGSTLFNLGAAPQTSRPTPRILAYRINKGNLTACDYLVNDCGLVANKDDPSVWAPIANNIVSMRAVYVKDTTNTAPGSGADQLWDNRIMTGKMDGIPDADDQATPVSVCGWARVSSINLALVARSVQFNKEPVDAPAPTWSRNAVAPITGLSTNYRYRVFESPVPLRNMGWMGAPTAC